jgi:hypothetical protein
MPIEEHPVITEIRLKHQATRDQLSKDYDVVKRELREQGLSDNEHFEKFMETKYRYHTLERQSRSDEADEVIAKREELGL